MTAMRRTSGDGSFLRSLNEAAVLRAVRETGTPTLAEVARAAQLSRATTEVIMDALQRNGWVVEAGAVAVYDDVAALLDGQRAHGAFLLRSVLTPQWSLRIEHRAPLTVVAIVRGSA